MNTRKLTINSKTMKQSKHPTIVSTIKQLHNLNILQSDLRYNLTTITLKREVRTLRNPEKFRLTS